MQLVHAIITSLERPERDYTSQQRMARANLHIWLQNLTPRLQRGDQSVYNDHGAITNGLAYLSQWLFMDTLRNVRITWRAGVEDVKVAGYTERSHNWPRNNYSQAPLGITIVARHRAYHTADPAVAAAAILSPVAHEACHALVDMYGCTWGCAVCSWTGENKPIIGVGGHGTAWHTLAYYIERKLVDDNLGLVTLNRKEAAFIEAFRSKFYLDDHVIKDFFGGVDPVKQVQEQRERELK